MSTKELGDRGMAVAPSSFDRHRRRITGTGVVIIWIATPLLVGFSRVLVPDQWIAVPAIAIGLLLPITQYCCRRAIDQVDREERVFQDNAVARIKSGQPVKFAIFLRPFWSDTMMWDTRTHMGDPIDPESTYDEDGRETIDRPVALLCARMDLILVKLGQPAPEVPMRSASSIDAGQGWFEEFCNLAARAHEIFIVPSATTDCLKELRWLRDTRRLPKAIVVLPPARMLKDEQHTHLANSLREAGFELPAYEHSGLVFRWNTDGSVERVCTFWRWKAAPLSKAVAQLTGNPSWSVSAPWTILFLPVKVLFQLVQDWVGSVVQFTRNWWLRTGSGFSRFLRFFALPIAVAMIIVVCFVIAVRRAVADLRTSFDE